MVGNGAYCLHQSNEEKHLHGVLDRGEYLVDQFTLQVVRFVFLLTDISNEGFDLHSPFLVSGFEEMVGHFH